MNNHNYHGNEQPKECERCFAPLDEDLECKSCDYEAEQKADHITENQFNGKV
jgi:hypothetical protein